MAIRYILLLLLIFSLSGCSLFNVYSSDFTCPQKENGKCVDVKTAYEESAAKSSNSNIDLLKLKKDKTGCKEDKDCSEEDLFLGKCIRCSLISDEEFLKVVKQKRISEYQIVEDEYTKEKMKKIKNMLKEPVTPIMVPPKILRVLILPYDSEGDLYTQRYIFTRIDQPKWIITDVKQLKESDE